MQIIDVNTKKEYKCNKCQAIIYYAKTANNMGVLYTKDGKLPNGKFGKESNILTCQVDALVKDRVHSCSKDWLSKQLPVNELLPDEALASKQVVINPQEPEVPNESPKVKEMDVVDFAEPAMRKEIQIILKNLKIVEEEVIKFVGTDSGGAKIGLWMKLVEELRKKK